MRRLEELLTDESGATLTTELALLSTLTVAGVMAAADDVREGFDRKTAQLVGMLTGEDQILQSTQLQPVASPSEQCVVVVEAPRADRQPEADE